ncbi:MAG: type II toxin-antitoxin system Phd/YefM family antitoxin [Planctomycetota bacterium]|nr:type II toxin-antitoxin system Phd/YefM family antitoxin [Planctomycetota bacterium]
MLTVSANEAKTRFGELLDRIQCEPVQVTRHGRMVGVMVPPQDYAAMRAFYADRLNGILGKTALVAEKAGMTEEALDRLLSDES